MEKIVIDGPHQIIAIGDSLTAGSQPGITDYAPFTGPHTRDLLRTSYPYVLSEMLSASMGPRLIRNLGRSGSLTRDWLPGGTWRKKDDAAFPLNGRPLDEIMESRDDIRLCLMMFGTNDVNSSITPDFLAKALDGVVGYEEEDFVRTRENILITLLSLKEKDIVTYLAKIPPNRYKGGLFFLGLDRIYFSLKSIQGRLDRYTRMVNERIEEILTSYPHLARRGPDFFRFFEHRGDVWSKDQMHLNTLGYRLMAWAWSGLIQAEGIEIRV
ncbi:MAG TPA: SGNH/GDSL hydrolase family protein [Deltaproteobacteria bacterium]|jgi:lysophospholipase L1-like esterase|nr:SGNH/GDSL hydrolase family protein [Deltaproteobacteria bacterium]HOI08135.1 SGNH/GDSL hydrolase family protein [Deltaproteobacteria bacterium]